MPYLLMATSSSLLKDNSAPLVGGWDPELPCRAGQHYEKWMEASNRDAIQIYLNPFQSVRALSCLASGCVEAAWTQTEKENADGWVLDYLRNTSQKHSY